MSRFVRRVLTTCALCAFLIFAPIALVSAQYAGANDPPDDLAPGFNSITGEQSHQWLSILAGPEFAGRGTGQLGYTKAAHWVAGKLAEFGLEPLGEGGTYFQMLPMSRVTADMSSSKITGPGGFEISGSENLGFERYGETPEVTGDVVFIKLVGQRPALDEELQLRDKIVVYVTGSDADFRTTRAIQNKQPAAMIQVIDDQPTAASELKRGTSRRRRPSSLSATITRESAQNLLKATGGDPSWIEVTEDAKTEVHETDAELGINVRLREESVAVPNVVAWLEGSDATLRHEHIVIGAHLDHLGSRGTSVFPGADDNGSGSTALLNVARALALNPVKPKRSVLFLWFAAEESGLVGSRHYTDNPIKPLSDVVCMLNMDMVGRNEETDQESPDDNVNTIHLIGSKQGDSGLHDVILNANQCINFEFEYDEEGVFGRSDQANFYRKGIPVAFLFGGFHPNYHQTTDTIDRINPDKIAAAARLFYLTIFLASEHGRFELKQSD